MSTAENDGEQQAHRGRPTDDEGEVSPISGVHLPTALHAVLELRGVFKVAEAKRHVDQLVAQAKRTDDPIEAMMIEQLAVAHHRIATLHVRAAEAEDLAGTEAYTSAATRLLGEFRRLALALQTYRTPTQGRSTTVVHRVEQWNQAEGDQEVGYARADGDGGEGQRICRDSELVGNPPAEDATDDLHARRRQKYEEPAAGGRRQAEPTASGTAD